MPFFRYIYNNFRFLGESEQDIRETIEHYKNRGYSLEFPSDRNPAEQLDKLEIRCDLPMAWLKGYISVKISEDFSLNVNVNAWDFIRRQAGKIKQDRRGKLYKFRPDESFYEFIPESVATALQKYDWTQHDKDVRRLEFEYDGKLERIGNHPNFSREKQEQRAN